MVTQGPGSLTMTMQDHSRYTFTPSATNPSGLYRLSAIANIVGRTVTIQRNSSDQLQSITNDASPATALLTFGYAGGSLAGVADPYGRTISYSFGPASDNTITDKTLLLKVSEINGGAGSTQTSRWQYNYAGVGNMPFLNSVLAPNPYGTGGQSGATTAYNATTGQVQSLKDANGNLRSYSYAGGTTQVTVSGVNGGQQWTQKYNPGGMNADTGDTDALGHSSTVTYNGTPSPYLPNAAINRNNQMTTVQYDPTSPYGNVSQVTDPRSTTTQFQYDYSFPLGQVKSVQTGNLAPTTYDYYPNGLVKDVYAPAPGTVGGTATVTTSYTYDALGNVQKVVAPGPNGSVTTTYNYTSYSFTDPLGMMHAYTAPYEALGEPVSVTSVGADGTMTAAYFQYDARGNRTAVTDALGNETDYAYDLADEPTLVTYPPTTGTARARTVTTYQYLGGPVSNVAAYDESNTRIRNTDYVYGPEGELQQVKDFPESPLYSYDARYRVIGVTDGNGNKTSYAYDTVGDLAGVSYPLANGVFDTLTYHYDSDNNLIARLDGNDFETDYRRYDPNTGAEDPESLVRTVHYAYPAPWTGPRIADVQYAYDAYGRRQTMGDGSGLKTYQYDDLDELLSLTTSFTGGPQGQALVYAYNPDGSRQSLTTPMGAFGYGYDGLGRMTRATFPWTGGQYTYSYYPNGWLQGAQGPQTKTAYGYSRRGFLTSLQNTTLSGAILSSFTGMTYDGVGNRLGETASVPAVSGSAGDDSRTTYYTYNNATGGSRSGGFAMPLDSSSFAYDNHRSLTSEQIVPGPNNYYDSGFNNTITYDPAGNPQSSSNGTLPTTFNQDNQISLSGFAYDGNGNPTKYPPVLSSPLYDPEDRLLQAANFSALYDGDGLRAARTAPSPPYTNPITTYFLNDGAHPVVEETYNPSSGATSIAAGDGWGADGWRARYLPAGLAPPGTGALSSLRALTYTYDPQGNVVERHAAGSPYAATDVLDYAAFGEVTGDESAYSTNQGGGPYRDAAGFGGQYGYYTDASTGLLLLGHRYYDPSAGRFLTRDPAGYGSGLNLYSLALGNPVNAHDPSGLSADDTPYGDDPEAYLDQLFSHATPADWLAALRGSPAVRALEALGEAASYVPLPENPAADARAMEEIGVGANIVYRALKPSEAAEVLAGRGIIRPSGGTTMTQHVMGANKATTPWLSATRSMKSANFFATHGGKQAANPIIAIDISKLTSPAYDVSTKGLASQLLKHRQAIDFASGHREVLIRGHINPEAIIGFVK